MSRLEGKIGGDGNQPVEAEDILEALAEEQRREAVRRYFSGGDGWREASASLGGAFAAKQPWLKPDGEE
ncbi:hypothetical protein H8M03_07850 [Sphingomonas sabuli]|uniref:Uncharacterized protein n=1 Tax=Sphingomonas sabuli TaxID=2764186 RepID=A0A7G9L000_9SPHN|nr:hypothetical protein [Sphingomonas sabuli]QNM81949.1 hypothetical protein H8M03_07850 [Sphingomonas sabuli]